MQRGQDSFHKGRDDYQTLDRREMIAWAEPVIADRVVDCYQRGAPGCDTAGGIMLRHRELWRSILLGQSSTVPVSRRELQRLGSTAGMPSGFFESVDQQIMEELFDIVLARYHASRASARRFGLILMAASAHLGAAREAA